MARPPSERHQSDRPKAGELPKREPGYPRRAAAAAGRCAELALATLHGIVAEPRRLWTAAGVRAQQLRLALEAGRMGFWEYRAESRVVELSPEARRILGFEATADSISLALFLDQIDPAYRWTVGRAILNCAETGERLDLEFRLRDEDGMPARWASARGERLVDTNTRLIGLFVDITDRVSERTLNSSEHRILEMISSGAPLPTVLDNLIGLIEAEAPGMICSIVLLDADGKHLRHGSAPRLPAEYIAAIDGTPIGPRAGSCGTALYLRTPVIVEDILTDPLWEDWRDLAARFGLRACWSMPVTSEQGRALGTIAVYYREPRSPTSAEMGLIDLATHFAAIVLERNQAEVAANEQRRALAHMTRVVVAGELSGTIAHELRQPLTAILSNAQAARRFLEVDRPDLAEIRAILQDIVRLITHMNAVIDPLRSMLRRDESRLEVVDLREIASSALDLARIDLAARAVRVETRFSERAAVVLADPIQLQQVLLNLVINASDSMSEVPIARRRLVVEVAQSSPAAAELAVTDSGVGIPVDVLKRIFDPFVTLKKDGLGLGLAICRSIVLAHGGTLTAENNPHAGATFRLSLPADLPDINIPTPNSPGCTATLNSQEVASSY